jgi:hypothetical protein
MERWSDGAFARWSESIHNHVRNEEHHSKDKKHIMKQKELTVVKRPTEHIKRVQPAI